MIPRGLIWMCLGQIISSILCLIVNTFYTGKLINLGFLKQLKDLLPSLAYSLSMGIVVLMVINCFKDNLTQLIVGVVAGIVYYLLVTKIINASELNDLLSLIRK